MSRLAIAAPQVFENLPLDERPTLLFVDLQETGSQWAVLPGAELQFDFNRSLRIPAANLLEASASPQSGQGRVDIAGHGIAQKPEDLKDRGFPRAVCAHNDAEIRQF
jgi:hypothetical protein